MLQHYLSILTILNTAKLHEALERCSASTYSVYGHSLSSHVNSTRISSSLSDCVMMCQSEFRCKSLNFRLRDKSCDLNDADRYTHPGNYGSQEGSVYMDASIKHEKVDGYICLIIILIIIIIVTKVIIKGYYAINSSHLCLRYRLFSFEGWFQVLRGDTPEISSDRKWLLLGKYWK